MINIKKVLLKTTLLLLIIVSFFTTTNNVSAFSDGTLDTSFDTSIGADSTVRTIAIQSDGKIIIGGEFLQYNGVSINRIARLNTDGTIDSTFTPGTAASGIVNAVAIQSDGKIIIGGSFTSYNGVSINRIARLNTDGTIDVTFTPGTAANNSINIISLQSDGKIIVGGSFI